MAIVNPVSYLHNRTDHTAQTDRLAVSGLLIPDTAGLTWRQGVRGFTDYIVQAQGTPNMSVNVGAGECFVNQSTAGNGAYVVPNDGPVTLTISAAHATLTRRDLIVVKVEDSFFTGAVDLGSLVVVVGTPSGSPVDPTVSGNYLILARITVAPAVASITNGAITDLRPKTAALGGVVPVNTTAERNALTAWRGRVVDNLETGALERYTGTVWNPLAEMPSWQSYSPTKTGMTGTVTGRYFKLGKIVFGHGFCAMSGAASGLIRIGLPTVAVANGTSYEPCGAAQLYDISVGAASRRSATSVIYSDGASIFFITDSLATSGNVDNTTPFTWANGDNIGFNFTYEEA